MRLIPTLPIIISLFSVGFCEQFSRAKLYHQHNAVTNEELVFLKSIGNQKHVEEVLDNILIPRVVGTENHRKVGNYIIEELRGLTWHVDVDEFIGETPLFGALTFRNIIATPNPEAERFLVLACHYDSKYFKDEYFVGATDSAVPCAMMLNLAKTMNSELCKPSNNDLSLKLIFFDGEEAFLEWGPTDSIYGAKHLAETMAQNQSLAKSTGESINELQKVDLLVLLDLIGARNPEFFSFFDETSRWFLRLRQIEQQLHDLKLLTRHSRSYFKRQLPYGRIEDDHIPFLIRQVPILHLIATPFPREWHTPKDNRELIDPATVDNMNLICRVFVTEYLHLAAARKQGTYYLLVLFVLGIFILAFYYLTNILGFPGGWQRI